MWIIKKSGMPQWKCILKWSCLNVNRYLYDQLPMKRLWSSVRQSMRGLKSTISSHKGLCPDPIISKIHQYQWKGYTPKKKKIYHCLREVCPCVRTSNELSHSCLTLQYKRNLITSKEQLCLKNHHRLKGICPYIIVKNQSTPMRGVCPDIVISNEITQSSHTPIWRGCLISF